MGCCYANVFVLFLQTFFLPLAPSLRLQLNDIVAYAAYVEMAHTYVYVYAEFPIHSFRFDVGTRRATKKTSRKHRNCCEHKRSCNKHDANICVWDFIPLAPPLSIMRHDSFGIYHTDVRCSEICTELKLKPRSFHSIRTK
jgi:hypothetical protein